LTSTAVQHEFASLPWCLRVALKGSLLGMVASVVLLGYITETQIAFYALISVSLVVYLLARGEELVGAFLDYLTSGKVLWRWAFVVWAILSLLWTTRGPLSAVRAVTLVEIQVVGLVFYDAARNLGLSRWILNCLFGCAVIAAVHALTTEDPTVVERLAGLYANPNTLGIICVIGLAAFISVAARRRRVVASIGSYVAALVLLVGIVASSSLKGMLGLSLVCGLGVAFSASRIRSVTFVGVAAGVGAALVAFVEPLRLVWEHALYRFEIATIGMSVGVNQSTVERARFIKKGLGLIADAPLFGRGLDTFRWLSSEGTYAHNNMIELGVALGLVGVVLYYGFHVSILRAAARLRRTDDFVWRFIVIAVPTLLLLDIAAVSYTSKLSTMLLIMSAGWLERTRTDPTPTGKHMCCEQGRGAPVTPLRVLYLIDSLGSGGAQRQLVTLVKSLDRTLVTPEVAVYHPLYHFRPELDDAGVPVHLLKGSGGRDPRVFIGLARLLARGRYDIVHSYLKTPGTLARLAAPFSRGTRVVVSERSVDLGHSRWRLMLERLLSGRAVAMIANAQAVAREVERLVPSWTGRIHVVPNGVDFRDPTDDERAAGRGFRARQVGDADHLLGVIGRVGYEKAPDLLVDALERLPEEILRKLRIVWIGLRIDTKLASSVELRLAGSVLAGRVVFLGETRDTRSVYLGVDGILLCSRWEGFPNVVLEALAHGTPVVATDVGDISEIVRPGESGWVVPPGDAKSLSAAIAELLSLPASRRAEMGKAGSAFVLDKYSAERLAERTLSVYRRVLDSREISADRRDLD
jgi:starch synthase (maltosyl-transferring)